MTEDKKCSFCREEINENSFRDKFSLERYNKTGMCQGCIDSWEGQNLPEELKPRVEKPEPGPPKKDVKNE